MKVSAALLAILLPRVLTRLLYVRLGLSVICLFLHRSNVLDLSASLRRKSNMSPWFEFCQRFADARQRSRHSHLQPPGYKARRRRAILGRKVHDFAATWRRSAMTNRAAAPQRETRALTAEPGAPNLSGGATVASTGQATNRQRRNQLRTTRSRSGGETNSNAERRGNGHERNGDERARHGIYKTIHVVRDNAKPTLSEIDRPYEAFQNEFERSGSLQTIPCAFSSTLFCVLLPGALRRARRESRPTLPAFVAERGVSRPRRSLGPRASRRARCESCQTFPAVVVAPSSSLRSSR